MDNPTKVLTVGIGALAAVAAFLGWQNTKETPEIIDSDVHDYDSKITKTLKTNVSGKFSAEIESDEEITNEKQEMIKAEVEAARKEKEDAAEAERLKAEEAAAAEAAAEAAAAAEAEAEAAERLKAEEAANAKNEVKRHLDKLPYGSAWGQFWKEEYNDINKEKEEEN